ncbi:MULTISPECIES: hypothetical protein [unclassified Shewanella]|uniref:hypothetical protein n=1 Tax=Shewanella TaxID=22 RepID=UPI0021D9DFB8|nr:MULTISPECIES: hypothetical protein [unclassified Shewanella]MCU8020875.1 hypothetical protein [Shewanella sp. SM78]MCU8043682.1 hypothetical protein [Shewanella sp. SM68]MCU8047765.1 hypothetical protein [Shewanella sp. SM65]MCU8077791.1 hypothetical protein [Shewanella sp. SM103]
MIFQQFQQSPLQTRISGPRAWLAMAISISLICLSLFLLPFVLLFGAIALGCLVLFSRFYMARQLAKFNQAQASATQHAHATEEPQSQVYGSDTIVRESNAARHQGRTFEHKEDEH